jgi:hypothetical protein
MLHSASFEMIRHLDDELRQVSIRKFWWRYARPEPEPIASVSEAEVIELAFGAQCEMAEPLGA